MDLSSVERIDWAEFFDEEGKVPYYVSLQSHSVQSEQPEEYRQWREKLTSEFLSKSNWRKREHEGKYFYYDKLTGTSVWEPPKELVEFEKQLVQLTQQWYQESARKKAEIAASAKKEVYEGEDWIIGGESGSDDGFGSDRTPSNHSPGLSELDEDGEEDRSDEESYFFNDKEMFDEPDAEVKEEKSDETLRAEIASLEKKLTARDAVMEPGLYHQISRYLHLTNKHPQDVVNSLCKGYVGYAQLTHVICDWILIAEKGEQAESSSSLSNESEEMIESFVAEKVAAMIKNRFDSSLADKLMDDADREPEWLLNMMRNVKEPRWRRLLIELSDEHRDSILLNWCVRELAHLGYHREIAQVIREADYFSVCNELLIDTLCRIGSAIAAGGSVSNMDGSIDGIDGSNVDNISTLLRNLIRMCSGTEYMFIYSSSLLNEVMKNFKSPNSRKRTHDEASVNDVGADIEKMWARKIMRVGQELEGEKIWCNSTRGFSPSGWSIEGVTSEAKFAFELSAFNEVIDVSSGGLSLSSSAYDLRKNIRCALENGAFNAKCVEDLYSLYFDGSEDSFGEGCFRVALLPHIQNNLLQRCSTPNNDNSSTDCSIFELLSIPQLLHLLIIFVCVQETDGVVATTNGYSRHQSQAAYILSLAYALKVSKDCDMTSLQSSIGPMAEKVCITREVCLELGSMSSKHSRIDSSEVIFEDMSRNSLISGMYLTWLETKVCEPLFVIRAKQLAIYPIIMQMLVVGINTYTSQRGLCFQIIKKIFQVITQKTSTEETATGELNRVEHREKDLSEISLGICQDLMDLLIHLIGKGYIYEPLHFLAGGINSLDKALIRSFLSKILQTISPPFSTEFVTMFSNILLLPRAIECLESSYFSSDGAKGLEKFVDIIEDKMKSESRNGRNLRQLVANTLRLAKSNIDRDFSY